MREDVPGATAAIAAPAERNPLVPSFYASRALRNGCAQAAVAWLLTFLRRSPYPPGADLVAEIYRRYPPNTPFALFGTTPGRLERICHAYGLRTARWSGAGARERLEAELAAGRPVVVLLDLARLGGGIGFHYAVACSYNETGVTCANMLPTRRFSGEAQALPWSELMLAWKCRLPAGRFKCAGMAAW